MMTYFKKYISAALLVVLAWSCFGLGLGMISHEMSAAEGHETTEHSCCISTNAEQATPYGMGSMEHHSEVAAVLVVLLQVAAVIFFVLLVPFVEPLRNHYYGYLRKWQEKIQYYAYFIVHLFSRGILHPKTW